MESFSWKEIAEFSGTLAIVGSLVFVGLEIQQSREIAIADVYQQQAALLIDIQTNEIAADDLSAARIKSRQGEALTDADYRLLFYGILPWLTYYENIHFQYQAGLLSEEHWLSAIDAMRNLVRGPNFRMYWEYVGATWRESFAREINELIQEEYGEQ